MVVAGFALDTKGAYRVRGLDLLVLVRWSTDVCKRHHSSCGRPEASGFGEFELSGRQTAATTTTSSASILGCSFRSNPELFATCTIGVTCTSWELQTTGDCSSCDRDSEVKVLLVSFQAPSTSIPKVRHTIP